MWTMSISTRMSGRSSMRWRSSLPGGGCLFERLHHRRIASILQALDASFLAGNGALFGGGTAIALRHGEYRESVDIDFMVASVEGYRALRQRLTGMAGMRSLLQAASGIQVVREVRTDQYGIRTMLDVDG